MSEKHEPLNEEHEIEIPKQDFGDDSALEFKKKKTQEIKTQ
jgi:hypothetical protein